MATRPTTSREWAESADADDVSEPTVERPRGYRFEEDLPNDQLNWLLQQLFRWADYFDDKFQNATGLIDFFTEIDFGSNGDFTKQQDDTSEHHTRYEHTLAGDTRFEADILQGSVRVVADTIQSQLGDYVNPYEDDGSSGGFLLRVLRPITGQNDVVDFEDDDGNSGQGGMLGSILEAGGLNGDFIRFDGQGAAAAAGGALLQKIRPNTGQNDLVDVEDDGGSASSGGFALAKLKAAVSNTIDVIGVAGGSGTGDLKLNGLVNDGLVDFLDTIGNSGVGGAFLSTLKGGDSGDINVLDNLNNYRDGHVKARNVVRAFCTVDAGETPSYQAEVGFSGSPTKQDNGVYLLTLDEPVILVDDLVVTVTCKSVQGVIGLGTYILNSTQEIIVHTYQETTGAFDLTDLTFSVHVCYATDPPP